MYKFYVQKPSKDFLSNILDFGHNIIRKLKFYKFFIRLNNKNTQGSLFLSFSYPN